MLTSGGGSPNPAVRVIIAAGGTGGHLFPALALAEGLRERGARVLFVGRKKGMEAKLLNGKGFRLAKISSSALKRGFSLTTPLLPFVVAKGIRESLSIFREFHPRVVVGMGGYVSFPLCLAARVRDIPILLQEQNLLPGLTNRLLAPLATEVCLSFPESRRYLKGRSVRVTGNPVRGLRRWGRKEARQELGLGGSQKVLLVLGGSQGAHSLNLAIGASLDALLRRGIGLIWQTGKRDYQWAKERTRGLQVKVEPFFDDMGLIYSAADLVMSRAGGSTIAEITLLGKPSILVPYPFSTGGHQRLNAQALVRRGAAQVLEDRDLTGEALVGLVIPLLGDEKRLRGMANAAAQMAKPGATKDLMDSVLRLANAR